MASRPGWGVALDTAGWGHPRLDAAVGVAPPSLALTLWQATRPATHRSTASLAESRSHDPGRARPSASGERPALGATGPSFWAGTARWSVGAAPLSAAAVVPDGRGCPPSARRWC